LPRYTKPVFAEREGVSVNTLNNWIYRYGLPVIQIGVRTYIDDDDFQTWIAGHRKVIQQVPPDRPKEIALPKQCRNRGSSILSKLRPAR
jgi:hypothetical protein